jgi:hypothetical protein
MAAYRKRTEIPKFSKRNHHFYVNKCGFKIWKIENPKEWNEGQYLMEKPMEESMEIDAIGLFANNMETMVKFYRDIIGLKTNWENGEPYADFDAGKCRLIMYGRNDFEKMVSKHSIARKD